MTKSVFTPQYQILLHMLTRAREEKKLSQRRLSEMLDMPSSYVGKYETGERRIDYVEVSLILKALGLDFVKFGCRWVAACEKDLQDAIPPKNHEKKQINI